MENKNNVFEEASNTIDKSKELVRNTFKTFLNYISYLIIIAITVFFSLAYIGFTNKITWDAVLQAGIILAINISSMSIFILQGEDNEKNKSSTYKTNLIVWAKKVNLLETKKLIMQFRAYCKERTEQLRQEIKESLIASAGIEVKFYEEHLSGLSLKQLKQLRIEVDKRNEKNFTIKDNDLQLLVLTRHDYRKLKKASGEIKVKPISYAKILAGSIRGKTNKALQEHSGSYKAMSVGIKSLSIIFFALATVVVSILPTGANGFQAVLDIAWRIFGVTVSSIMGFYTGVKSIKIQNSDNKEKILFIDEFLEYKKVDNE